MSVVGEAKAPAAIDEAARDDGAARRALLRRLVGGAAIGGGIKVASVGLAFLFFLVLARVTDPVQYGIFASAFSLATILGFAATVGQHTAILRFWPALDERHGPGVAAQATRRGLKLTALGSGVVLLAFLGLAASGFTVGSFGEGRAVYAWIGAMALAFALSEFAVGALRARGLLVWALGPREILWRVAVITLALLLPPPLDGATALALAALVLIAMTLPQLVALALEIARHRETMLPAEDRAAMRHATWGLWALALVNPVGGHGATVVVGVTLGPTAAGAYFAADRLARMLSIPLIGLNQVVAPMLARAYHSGRREDVRFVTMASSAIAFAVAFAGYTILFLFGRNILAIFDPSYGGYHLVLLVLGAGHLVSSACGPAGILLHLSGKERTLLALVATSNAISLAIVLLIGRHFGLVGVATAVSCALAAWNLAASRLSYPLMRGRCTAVISHTN